MSEWTKQSITDLINEYKEQRSLYDPKHSLVKIIFNLLISSL